MPIINRKYLSEKPVKYKSESTERNQEFYNSLAWKRLRKTFLSQNPLCKICLEHERVVPAVDVHHKIPFIKGRTQEEKWELLLDEKNLIPVCEKCHLALHMKDRRYSLSSLDTLTDTEYRYCHGLNFN